MVTIKSGLKRALWALVPVGLVVAPTLAFADGDISSLSTNIATQAGAITHLLNIASYVAGVGFALAAILQFKAHKENPQSMPLSKPVVMLIVAAALLFLPFVINIAGQSLFGGGQSGQGSDTYKTTIQ